MLFYFLLFRTCIVGGKVAKIATFSCFQYFEICVSCVMELKEEDRASASAFLDNVVRNWDGETRVTFSDGKFVDMDAALVAIHKATTASKKAMIAITKVLQAQVLATKVAAIFKESDSENLVDDLVEAVESMKLKVDTSRFEKGGFFANTNWDEFRKNWPNSGAP